MSDSPHLGLGYLAPAQAQKHVTVNEAFRRLDALVQLGALSRTLTAPPPGPVEGDRHIVAAGATGAWAGQAMKIAAFLDGVWVFVEPKPGWLAYVADEGALVVFLAGEWVGALGSLASLEALTRLGVNATSDVVNRLAVGSEAVLFNHDGAGVQVKLNKASLGDTASLLFQDGYSGRAEIGLAGSDAFSLKVSADGSSWTSALTVDPTSGAVDTPATPTVEVAKFTASGTWTRPAWARRVRALLVSGGNGGGSGALRGTGVGAAGGSGGGPGVMVEAEFLAADLDPSVAVTVGSGGAGGAAQTSADTNGNPGIAGGATSFGLYLKALPGASFGLGGTAAAVAGGSANGYRNLPPGADVSGGSGATTTGGAGGVGPGRYGAGGGGGGGASTANAAGGGGAAGAAATGAGFAATIAGGAAPGGAGSNGGASTLIDVLLVMGGSGSGGAGGVSTDGGQGGDGGAPGGSGGGGGGSRNGFQSGKGGAGARGEAWIVSMR